MGNVIKMNNKKTFDVHPLDGDFMIDTKTILTDCDGVLLNWRDAFDAWMMREKNIFAGGDVNLYDQAVRYDLPPEEIFDHIKQFNSSANMGFLPPLYDSVKYVRKLHEEHGFKFTVITSLSLNQFAIKLRMQNLHNIFGEHVFDEIVCLDTGADKDEILKQYAEWNPGAFWLEDKVKNAIEGRKHGLRSYLMKHVHIKTEDRDGIPVVANWKQLYEEITGS